MKVVELNTGLFPDAACVEQALATLEGTHEIEKIDLAPLDTTDDAAWEEVASAVLGADLIVTL